MTEKDSIHNSSSNLAQSLDEIKSETGLPLQKIYNTYLNFNYRVFNESKRKEIEISDSELVEKALKLTERYFSIHKEKAN